MEKIITEYNKGSRVQVKITEDYEMTPLFDRIGTNTGPGFIKPFKDLEIVMENLSTPAHWLFWRLSRMRNKKNNVSILKARDNLEAKKIAKGYKALFAAGIVVRFKRQHYLIHPKVWFPDKGEFGPVLERWNTVYKERA